MLTNTQITTSQSSALPKALIAPRPYLKWAGGKSKLIKQYTPYLPKTFQTYYEPFLGGGAIFFHLHSVPTKALLTDINPELINVYCCVRDRPEKVIQLLQEHQERHNTHYYYQIRSLVKNSELRTVERAARLIYLNKTCFNGLYRENAKGEFNVPVGQYKNPKICDPDLLYSASIALQFSEIKVSPFEAVLDHANTDKDFVYFDPPYYPLTSTSNFTAYSRYSFGKDDQVRLQNTFATLAKRGVKVMLSNSDCPLIQDLYKGFNIHPISASRAINSNPKKRGKIAEVLVTSY